MRNIYYFFEISASTVYYIVIPLSLTLYMKVQYSSEVNNIVGSNTNIYKCEFTKFWYLFEEVVYHYM